MTRITTLLWIVLLLSQTALAEETAKGLTSLGWMFMICSIGGVWALAIFCYKKLLFED